MHVTAIIAAGGRGRRLGAAVPKQLLAIGDRPMLELSVQAFARHGRVNTLVVVLPPELVDDPPAYLTHTGKPTHLVVGGGRRQDSVANGLAAVELWSDIVLVHDAARPFVDADVIDRVIDAAAQFGAAICAVQARDTVKVAEAEPPVVSRTLPRECVYLAQTPQGFRRAVLADAVRLGQAGVEATDEAFLAERAGYRVQLVEGSPRNMKITSAEDMALAQTMATKAVTGTDASRLGTDAPSPGTDPGELSRGPAKGAQSTAPAAEAGADGESRTPGATRNGQDQETGLAGGVRVGLGYDVHRLVDGRKLILGGVEIPFERGLLGHSDADVLCHAITDAVLGAAGAGDIGRHFPDTDERWRGASSLDLLARATCLVRQRGFAVSHVDAVVVAERPKLTPHSAAIAQRLAAALQVAPSAVSVKGKTNEGLGELGRGEAIACHAVATLTLDVTRTDAARRGSEPTHVRLGADAERRRSDPTQGV
jgi:2-C-methyl-D-erythritol 4-phosphate cytidylyltransferase / 2-C-methyl-D-erythritol 2,4-cyclodiphosphate synthase